MAPLILSVKRILTSLASYRSIGIVLNTIEANTRTESCLFNPVLTEELEGPMKELQDKHTCW